MNTSTKILLGLIITILIIPFLLAMTLKSKVSNKEYTTGKYNYHSPEAKTQKGQLAEYKNIQIIGSKPGIFNCHLRKADQAGYSYTQYPHEDSIEVYVAGDTLFIKHVMRLDKNGKPASGANYMVLNLDLPALTNITINSASVVVDSVLAAEGGNINLKNSSEIKQENIKKDEEDSAMSVPAINGKETAQNAKQAKIVEAGLLKQPTQQNKEVKDVVVFHLM